MEPFSNNSGGLSMNGPMEAYMRTNYNHEFQNQSPSSSTALNRPLLTRAQAMENFGEWGWTPTSLEVPDSYPLGNLPSFHSGMWQEVDIPIRSRRFEPRFFHADLSVALDHQPHNFDPSIKNITPKNLRQERTRPTASKEYQSSSSLERQVTDRLGYEDAPVPTDAEARVGIIKQEHGGADGHDEFPSFQPMQSRPLAKMHDCYICNAKFFTSEALGNHYRSHEEGARHKCQYCGCGFKTTYSRLQHHLRGKCAGYSALGMRKKMSISAVEWSRGDTLRQQHREPPKRMWLSRSAEVTHDQRRGIGEHHDDGAPIVINVRSLAKPPIGSLIQCPHCTKRLSCERLFRVHWRVHSGDKPFSCNVCQAKFASVQALASHASSLKCRACKRSNEKNSAQGNTPEQYKQNLKSMDTVIFDSSGESDGDVLQIKNDHSYSISQTSGSKLWEKARKNIKIIISKPRSHHCSKCRAFFADDKFAAHACGLAENENSTADIENASDCENDNEAPRNDVEPSPLPSSQRPQIQSKSLLDCPGVQRIYQSSSMRSGRQPDSLPGSLKGLGKFKCPLCETRFRRTRTVRRHLVTYHRVSTASQKALGLKRSSTSSGNSMTHLEALAENVKECIGHILKTAEAHTSIRAKFRRVGRSDIFEVDIVP